MTKNFDTINKDFQKELKQNDKKVQNDINTQKREEMSKEFVNFVKTNNCKIKGKKTGGKNDK